MKTNTHISKNNRFEQAQGMVEFALILPLLLFIIFGLIEFGHLLASYSMLTSATRDAARYASAAGDVGGGVPHYLDCAGIRSAARQNAILVNIPDENIVITYDSGPGTAPVSTTCPATVPITLGMRVVIQVNAMYEPIVGVAGLLDPFNLTSTTVRTILTNVEVEGTPGGGGGGGLPQVFFSTASATVAEDVGNYTLQVKLTVANSGETYVPFAVSGSAAYCDDFSVSANSLENVCEGPVTGTFHIPAGQTSANVVVAVSNDSIDEEDESVVLTLSKPANATLGSPTVFELTITDNDGPPPVHFASVGQGGNENIGGLSASVQLDSVSGKDVTVPYYVTDSENAAKLGVDYTLDAGSVTVPAGSTTASFSIGILEDTLDEDDENFTIHMGTPINANPVWPTNHTVTIVDNDQPPVVSFDIAAQSVGENMGSVNVSITLTPASSRPVTVPFTVGGTATLTTDYTYTPSNNTLTIAAGATTAQIAVTLVQDGLTENNETVIFTMGNPTNATKGATSVHTLTILGVTTQPQVSFQVGTGTPTAEGLTSIPVRIVLSNMWTQDVSVPVNINAGSTATRNKDYTVAVTSVTIPTGQTYVDYVITLMDDTLDETEIETVILDLGTPVNGTLGTTTRHTAQIQDNDAQPVVTIRINPSYSASNPESITGILVDINLSHGSGNTVSIPFSIGGSGTQGTNCQTPPTGVDYCVSPASPATIAPEGLRAQITLTIVDDVIYGEPNETVVLTLGTPQNAILGLTDTSTTYTINENDLCPSLSPMPNPNGSKLDLTISNPSDVTVLLTSISLYWYDNPSNQSLSKIYLGASKIWAVGASSSPATISTGWPNNENFRQIASGSSAVLEFVFSVSPLQTSSSDYVSVTFSNGCTISVRRSN